MLFSWLNVGMNYRRWGRERNKESNAIMESPEERCHRHEQGRCQWRRKRGIRIWELFINRTRGLECVKENKKGEHEPWKNRPDDSWHRLHPAPQVHFLPSFVWVFHKQDLVSELTHSLLHFCKNDYFRSLSPLGEVLIRVWPGPLLRIIHSLGVH